MARPGGEAGGRDRFFALIPASVQPLVDQLLVRCQFPALPSHLDCAVSGGADSTALLVLATAAGNEVTAHHVDHGLRPGGPEEAQFVAATAERFRASFVAHRVHIDPGSNLEARARTARYGVLPGNVATGHTLDDRAETVLINLLRGAARTGLSPLRSSSRHPLVSIRRSETVQLCSALDLEVVQDPTNEDPAHLRNRVRKEVLPLLEDVAGRDLAPVLDRQADILAAEDLLLDELARKIDATDARAVASAHPALARRAMRIFIMESWSRGHPPGVDAVDRALQVARGAATACEIEGGHRVYRSGQRLGLAPP